MAELLVWTGGDRNVLNPLDRFDGYVTAIKGDGHIWGDGDLKNHRVIKLPGVATRDVAFLLEQKVFKDKIVGRRAQLIDQTTTDQLKALSVEETSLTKTFLEVSDGGLRKV